MSSGEDTQLPNSDQCRDTKELKAGEHSSYLTQHRNQGKLPAGGDLSLVSNDKKELNKQSRARKRLD